MARLPNPGSDNGTWGNILNDFLSQSHNPDGTVKAGVVSKSDVGLGNVDNTSDINKPVSTATQTALDTKFTLPSLTSGSVLFSNGTTIAQDNSNLFWDSSTKRLGIGTNAPAVAFNISGSTFAGTQMRGLAISDTDNATLSLRRARAGTTAVQATDVLGGITWRGYDGTGYGSVDVAAINVLATSNFTTSNHGAKMAFGVTQTGSISSVAPMVLYGDHLDLTYDISSPTGVQSAFYSTITGKGDNATFIGVAGAAFNANDRNDVDATNKGVLIGLIASVSPRVTRNNVPYDDVNGIMISNNGTGRATDAIYIARHASFAGASEWMTTLTSDADANYGIRLMGTYTTQMLSLSDKFVVDAAGKLGIGTTLPTHAITLASTTTGIALYNTADQTTNYERVRAYWSGGVFNFVPEISGTGATRSMYFGQFSQLKLQNGSTAGAVNVNLTTSSANSIHLKVDGTQSGSSGVQYGTQIVNTISQTSTAGYTALLVNPTETSVGSGAKLLADFQVGGVSKVRIDNSGSQTLSSGAAVNLYNTADQTTNYERLLINWSSNVAVLATGNGGSGTVRPIILRSGASAGYTADSTAAAIAVGTAKLRIESGSTSNQYAISVTGTSTAATSVFNFLTVAPTINQSSTAGYTALLVNPTETTTGSGTKLLADFQIGGASKFSVNSAGTLFVADSAAPATPTGGGVIYVEAGALKYKGSSGTVSVLAPA